MSGYNGWSNFETWSIFVHFQPETKEEVDFAKACFCDAYEELPVFIRNLLDVSKINWGEIYTAVYDSDDDDEQTTPTIMICNCDEWVRENCGVDFSQCGDEVALEWAGELTDRIADLLSAAGFEIEFPHDGKSTYHGWHGFRGWKHRFGICATFDELTDDQFDKVCELIQEATDRIEHDIDRIRRRSFNFKTDSESGTINAGSFDEACGKLREMYPPEIIEDGGWGWVEDHNGNRFVVGEVP